METTVENQVKSPDQNNEEETKKGLKIVVSDPEGIYHVTTRFNWDENEGMLIQNDEMNDNFCSSLTTIVEHDIQSFPGDQNEFHFSSGIHTKGKNASISKFKKGYITDDEMDRLLGIFESAFGNVNILDSEEKRSVQFESDENIFILDLGFLNAKSKAEWEKRLAEERKMHIKQRPSLRQVTDYNSYTVLRSIDHPNRPSLSAQENFCENIKMYAAAYEKVLAALYHIHDMPEPDRILEFRYKPVSGEHLQVVK